MMCRWMRFSMTTGLSGRFDMAGLARPRITRSYMSPEMLRGMVVFVEVARLKGFSRAGLALEMPVSTVSRRIAEFERDIGLRLLKRTTKKVELTEEGEAYFLRCQRIMEDIDNAHEEVLGTRVQPRGQVRVAMTADFGLRLVTGLPDFCRRYPELVVDFELTTRVVDPATENCDVAIYIGTPPDSGLTAIKLAEGQMHLYASPDYLRTHPPVRKLADLKTHACIRERLNGTEIRSLWTLYKAGEKGEVRVSGPLVLNGIGLIRRLAVGGAGIALLPGDLCREEVASGKLVRVLKAWAAAPLPIFALTATRMMPARTRIFLEFLKSQL